jgi:hypothetical protein
MTKNILTAGQTSGNVSFLTAQKMIHRLLNHDRIKTDLDDERIKGLGSYNEPETKIGAFTKERLAEKLGISPEEIENLKSPDFYEGIANKISLPLARLYCATKFVNGAY